MSSTMTNNIQLSRQRDNQILSLLQNHRYLTSKHFEQLISWSYTICARRLQKLADPKQGLIKRWRPNNTSHFIYYRNQRGQDMKHWLLLASTYCYLKKEYGIRHWQPEKQFSMLRADAYTKDINAFVEIDLGTNDFNKVPLYQMLYDSDEWISDETPKKQNSYWFPRIIVVTCRKKSVEKRIERDDSKLKFIVIDAETIENSMD